MAKINDSIMSLIKPGRIASAAAALGETEQKTSSAIDIILPSLLARALKKGDTPEIRDVVGLAAKLKVSEHYSQIWEGDGIFDGKNIGERMENQLLGVENPRFYSAVASGSGIKKENADRLTNWVAGTVAGYFGERVAAGKSYASLLEELAGEKEALRKDIPSGIITGLGLASLLGTATAKKPASGAAKAAKEEKTGRWNWLLWLALILLILLLLLWWRSCDRKNKAEELVVITEQVAPAPAPAQPAAQTPGEIIKVLDGQEVTIYQDASPDFIRNYLGSDKFKNATEAQLKNVWFEFSHIDFEHNSATALMPNGEKQVADLAAILGEYPGAKVMIGAFADKTGTRAVNFDISLKRAGNIKAAFEKAGLDAGRISTEGFGEGYAQVAESATDAQRAPDRDIALRFMK